MTIIVQYEGHLSLNKTDIGMFDFLNLEEASKMSERYSINRSEKGTIPSRIKVLGLWKSLRLIEDAYYEMNLDIGDIQISQNENGSPIGYTIDCSNIAEEQRKTLFVKVEDVQFAMVSDTASICEVLEFVDDFPDGGNSFIRINDVKQGNWNELHRGESIPIVYDIGTNKNDTNAIIKATASKYVSQYAKLPKKPVLVISHWDEDHYNCLLQLTNIELSYFSYVLCIRELPNATSQKAYLKVCGVPAVKVVSIPSKSTSRYNRFPIEAHVSSSKYYSIYQGVGNDRNTRGIILAIRINQSVSFLTGDAAWYQLSHIVREEANRFGNINMLNLVVPHHGSGKDDTYKGFVLPPIWNYGSAGISVSKIDNRFGHPSATVVDFMKNQFISLKRTDTNRGPIYITL